MSFPVHHHNLAVRCFQRLIRWFRIDPCSQTGEEDDGGAALLPDDMIMVVCSRLPAKSLFKLQLVSKDLRSMILSDRSFQLLQSYHRTTADGIFIQTYFGHKFVVLDPDAGIPPSSLAFMEEAKARILGSSHGLLFLYHKKDECSDRSPGNLCVYNPARKTWWPLPAPPGARIHSQFSCIAMISLSDDDPIRGKYQLILVTPTPDWSNEMEFRVYNSTAEAWTIKARLHVGPRALDLHSPVVCGATVFWASDCFCYTKSDPYVVCLDTKKECCTEIIPVPEDAVIDSGDEITMGLWEGKLPCLLHHSKLSRTLTLWALLREEKGRSRWKKLHESSNLHGVGFKLCNNGGTGTLLVFSVEDGVFTYSIKEDKIDELTRDCGSYRPTLFPYSNSLGHAPLRSQRES